MIMLKNTIFCIIITRLCNVSDICQNQKYIIDLHVNHIGRDLGERCCRNLAHQMVKNYKNILFSSNIILRKLPFISFPVQIPCRYCGSHDIYNKRQGAKYIELVSSPKKCVIQIGTYPRNTLDNFLVVV